MPKGDAWRGKHLPQEVRDKISKTLTGYKWSEERNLKISKAHKGKKMPKCVVDKIQATKRAMFEGHRSKAPGGYIYVTKWNHPFANCRGRIMEHRLVMEEKIGRYLTKKEVVHHLNHDKTDNRIENLELSASQSEHLSKSHHDINNGRKLTPEHRAKVIKTLNWYNKHNSSSS